MKSNKSNGQLTAQIQMGDHKKSGFDLSNNVLGTGRIGRIIPTRALHVMPGDTIKQDSKVAVQFEPLSVPILANMDVRQEHFYVPYNVVWKNWDKFISSGEKLDYHGVVPNVSMKRILDVVLRYLITDGLNLIAFDYAETSDPEQRDYKVFRSYELTTQLEAMQVTLDSLGNEYYIKDLLRPQYEAIKVWSDNLQNYANEDLFIVYPNVEFTNNVQAATNVVNGSPLNGNKYFDLVKGLIVNKMTGTNAEGFTAIPTEAGLNFVIDFYNYIRSFVGYSSNIDYLNMNRMSISDLLVYCIDYLTSFEHNEQYNLAEMSANGVWRVAMSDKPMSVLHLRANYNIWFNNYRDILLESDSYEPYDGDDITDDELFVLLVPRQRCWEKDAFTTALDNPGTGNVGVPLDYNYGDMSRLYELKKVNDIGRYEIDEYESVPDTNVNGSNIAQISIDGETWNLPTQFLSGINKLVDYDNLQRFSSGFSLYQLEAAQRAQKWLQKALFFGNRISDFYYMHFGVRFLDARLRLPELLTSSRELVKLDVVMNNTNITTEAGGEVYQSIAGDRAAYASAYDNGNSFERFCEEHGVIMSFLTIMPQVTYAYGMSRDYSRLDQFDFAFSEFATLGMDAVYSSEITNSPFEYPISVFGYQGKYYDYKSRHSEEHGELLDSQDMYTFARKFNMYDEDSRPKLNYEFVHCFPSLDMFVVNSDLEDYFRYDIRHSTAAERNLPSQSIYI